MAKSKTDHIIMRNSKMFCSHCGTEQAIAYPIEIPVFSAMTKAFSKSHANCAKTWQQPVVDQKLPVNEKAGFWLQHGERGTSSEYLFQILSGKNINAPLSCPSDPSDFYRCHQLLQTVPEWREKLWMMNQMSPLWSKLVDNWEALTALLQEQIDTDKSNSMYDMMKGLEC